MVEQNEKLKKLVTYHKEGVIGFITLNRPEKRNAMNVALWDSLNDAIGDVEKDPDARVIIV